MLTAVIVRMPSDVAMTKLALIQGGLSAVGTTFGLERPGDAVHVVGLDVDGLAADLAGCKAIADVQGDSRQLDRAQFT